MINNFIPIVAFAKTNVINKTDSKNQEVFYEDFSGDKLDTTKWLIAEKAWGGNNGGVVAENVSISNGLLKLEGHGDKYEGDIKGINKPDGKRTGAAVATKEYFGSGSYEVIAKVCPKLGACSAIWTFEYEEYYPGDEKYEELSPGGSYYSINHEIDIEMPGRPEKAHENISYDYALCNTWIGERGDEYTTSYTKLSSAQNDGKFHTYRFDWHTGDKNEIPRVEFYIDGKLVKVNKTHIPTNKGRLWIGIWFPNGWAGTPDFDTEVFEIASVKITPFNEAGDTEPNETYPNDGWHDTELDKTAQEIIHEMGAGWNLGNTLDSCDYKKQYQGQDNSVQFYETLWKNPQITEQLVYEIKKSGFNSIRIPVTYYDHCDEKGIINEIWLDRVEEVVNYVLNNDMYCVLDIHHDTGLCSEGSWIVADADKYEENAYKLKKLWEQIANRFKDYDYKLIFEGFNEIVDSKKDYDWITGYDATINVNKLNQIFVNTIRESGGKNKNRFLAVTTFGGITDEQKLSTFEMPQDTAQNRIILALHDYSSDSQNITKLFERIKKYCTDKNIPVILDEFGTTSSSMSEENRAKIAGEYVSKAKNLGIACFWWDDGGEYTLYDRKNMNWKYEKIKDAIINQYKDNRPDEDNPDNNQPDKNQSDENKPDNNQPDENKPDENKPDNNQPDKNKPNNSQPDQNKPNNDNLNNNIIDDGRAIGKLPYTGTTSNILQILIIIMLVVTIIIYIKLKNCSE